MTNEQIKQKYGIELILKEGWCWDSDKTIAEKCLCLYKDSLGDYNFFSLSGSIRDEAYFQNFSETDPNLKEPKIGDWGWFSNIGSKRIVYDELVIIHSDRFEANGGGLFNNFSHEKPSFLP